MISPRDASMPRARAYARPSFGSLTTCSGAGAPGDQLRRATSADPSVDPLSTMMTSHLTDGSTTCAARCASVCGRRAAELWQQTTTDTNGLASLKRPHVSGDGPPRHGLLCKPAGTLTRGATKRGASLCVGEKGGDGCRQDARISRFNL